MRLFYPVTWALAAVRAAASLTTLGASTAGIEALVQRRLPNHADSFSFELVDLAKRGEGDLVNDNYVVSSKDGKIHVQGNTVGGLFAGLHDYLSTHVHLDVWWFIENQLNLAPQNLPALEKPLTGSSVVPYRYYLNTVTTSYTMVWWTWDQWQDHLDWMALRGINLCLAWTGFEKIYIEVFSELGFTEDDLDTYVTGAAFTAWERFGNIQGSWGGTTPKSWFDDQFALQMQILKRMGELGITPVLPAFTGFVPNTINRLFPSANVSGGSVWNDFESVHTKDTFLEPLDPMFTEIQARFIAKQQFYYGNITHIWTLDQYNENDPRSGDLDYLRSVSENSWKSIKAADPDGVWMMQGWQFAANAAFWTNDRVKAFLDGVGSNSDMLILDLFAESQPQWQRTNAFFGKPWIWCELHGYGGNYGLYGQVLNVTQNSIEALHSSTPPIGFGLTMEGLEGNEIMYDLMLAQAWSDTPIDTEIYFIDWATARYGATSHGKLPRSIYGAWDTVRTTVFNNTNLVASAVTKSIMELVPNITGMTTRTGHHPTVLHYDPSVMVKAWNLLYQAGKEEPLLYSNPAYQYDLVDWTRQVFSNAFITLYNELVEIYNKQDPKTGILDLQKQGKRITDLMASLDSVLATNRHFRLDTWIDAARASANVDDPDWATNVDFLEYQARNQVTLWGPSGQVSDYSSRAWSGLVGGYYKQRWQFFIDYLINTPLSEYDQSVFIETYLGWAEAWDNLKTNDVERKIRELEGLELELVLGLELEILILALIELWPDVFQVPYK